MTFQVLYFDSDGPTRQDAEIPTLEEATKLARRAIAAGSATRAEVKDASGYLLLVLPH